MPQFICLLRNSAEPAGPPMTPEDRDTMIADYQTWVKHLGDRLIQGERLARKSGRRARRRGKKLQITDGLPFGKGELEIREIEP